MTKPILTIRYATIDDAENVASFRIEQFKSAKEFQTIDLNAVGKQRGKIFIDEIQDLAVETDIPVGTGTVGFNVMGVYNFNPSLADGDVVIIVYEPN